MIEEPEPTLDDTSPTRAVSPDEHLLQEEPPLSPDDTSPSLITRQLAGFDPADRPRTGRLQRLLGAIMLLGALGLTAAATLIWLDSGNQAAEPASPASTSAAALPAPETTEVPSGTEPLSVPATDPNQPPLIFPTAAADEIAVALLTPAPVEPLSGALLRQSEPFTILPGASRTRVIQYTVQDGDTLETIADKFGLSDFYTLIWSNERSKYSPLRPGTQLNILPEDGVYYEVTEPISIEAVAEKYGVDPYAIIDSEYNSDLFASTPNTLLVDGMHVVIPGGEAERVNLLAAAGGSAPGGAASGGVLSGPYNLWGCNSTIAGGSPPYTRPLEAYTWMQGFALGGHEGVDLAPKSGEIGDPVYAAGSGTVAFAGWNSYGYGYVVVIAHGSVFSLYGHLSSYAVSCGQTVSAGQVIGRLGNTGNSSGPHLHFEVRDANWNALNPAGFVGF